MSVGPDADGLIRRPFLESRRRGGVAAPGERRKKRIWLYVERKSGILTLHPVDAKRYNGAGRPTLTGY